MTTDAIDYEAVLADLRVRREKLDAAILGIEQMLGAAPSGGQDQNGRSTRDAQSREVKDDSFLGMSMPEAAITFLRMTRVASQPACGEVKIRSPGHG